jgi:hypothetical protein
MVDSSFLLLSYLLSRKKLFYWHGKPYSNSEKKAFFPLFGKKKQKNVTAERKKLDQFEKK